MAGGWAGGGRDLPPDWRRRRAARFEMDAYRCVDCGHTDYTAASLECDHIGSPDDHRLEMLRTRCGPKARNCHGRKTAAEANARRAKRASVKRAPERHPGIL